MIETLVLIGGCVAIGGAIAIGGFIIGGRMNEMNGHHEPVKHVIRPKPKEVHLEVDVPDNIDDLMLEVAPRGEKVSEPVWIMDEPEEPKPKKEEPEKPERARCAVCNMFAKAEPFDNGLHYCSKHWPGDDEDD